jgi:hypothetical protein
MDGRSMLPVRPTDAARRAVRQALRGIAAGNGASAQRKEG